MGQVVKTANTLEADGKNGSVIPGPGSLLWKQSSVLKIYCGCCYHFSLQCTMSVVSEKSGVLCKKMFSTCTLLGTSLRSNYANISDWLANDKFSIHKPPIKCTQLTLTNSLSAVAPQKCFIGVARWGQKSIGLHTKTKSHN